MSLSRRWARYGRGLSLEFGAHVGKVVAITAHHVRNESKAARNTAHTAVQTRSNHERLSVIRPSLVVVAFFLEFFDAPRMPTPDAAPTLAPWLWRLRIRHEPSPADSPTLLCLVKTFFGLVGSVNSRQNNEEPLVEGMLLSSHGSWRSWVRAVGWQVGLKPILMDGSYELSQAHGHGISPAGGGGRPPGRRSA